MIESNLLRKLENLVPEGYELSSEFGAETVLLIHSCIVFVGIKTGVSFSNEEYSELLNVVFERIVRKTQKKYLSCKNLTVKSFADTVFAQYVKSKFEEALEIEKEFSDILELADE